MPSASCWSGPVLTLRLGDDDRPKPDKPQEAQRGQGAETRSRSRDVTSAQDVRIEDGTVNIVYDEQGHGEARRAYRRQSQPADAHRSVDRHRQVRLEGPDRRFQFRADHARRSPRETPREARARPRHAGDRRALRRQHPDQAGLLRAGRAVGQGPFDPVAARLDAGEARLLPPPSATASSRATVAWNEDEITFSDARFALEHASGQGQAVVTLQIATAACQGGVRARLSRPQPVPPRGQAAPAAEPAKRR